MFSKLGWYPLINFFYSNTAGSFKKMYQLATDHLSKLRLMAASDPALQDILNFFEPFYLAFLQQYEQSIDGRRAYHAKTAEFKELLEEVTGPMLRRWHAEVQMNYDLDSRQYKQLFPQGRSIFKNAVYEVRIQEVKSLGRALLLDPQLAALGATVEAYGQQLEALRDEQQGLEYSFHSNSNLLEQQREELSLGLFATFARLKFHYYRDVDRVVDFYELKYFRQTSSPSHSDEVEVNTLEVELAPNSQEQQLEGLLQEGSRVRLTHLRGEAVRYTTLANATASAGQWQELLPNQTLDLLVPAGQRILLLDNPTAIEAVLLLELL